ncbi:MAG: hypothetical protein F2681_12740 [Actinobacteria bacterium]|uniref:Unannotated protein n=1 Tax=freshwater metagenome TaxID=449393 RepID=A0A6J7C416_9ZZZZ|nr:hypothetical protein [Actinomycetota bacterium]MSX55389.1 hypothetical protein [Actinomycetota bacterium]MSX93398.1 hypothetical protein [Actinomycetota bacterium]MSZ83997.1 hypothetical protein [Actinomycetota bacterium]MTB16605.1 hypothetical protein [Actinomycetota bacterium]
MGFEVHIVVELRKPPTEALMSELDHKFEVAAHEHGTRTVSITEHVSVANQADAIAFVQSLVMDAMPENSKVLTVETEAD